MRIIEFFGPPGVGKSTLLDGILTQEGGRFVRRNDISMKRTRYNHSKAAETNPHWVDFSKILLNITPTIPNHLNYMRQIQRAVRYIFYMRHLNDERIALVDCGLCQRGLTVSLCKPSRLTLINKYFQLIPPPLNVVLFNLDTETIRSRNHERVNNGFGWSFADQAEELNTVYAEAKLIFIERNVNYLEIDANLPVEINISKVLRWIDDSGNAKTAANS